MSIWVVTTGSSGQHFQLDHSWIYILVSDVDIGNTKDGMFCSNDWRFRLGITHGPHMSEIYNLARTISGDPEG